MSMVSLADVKAHLGITTVDAGRDVSLQLKLDAAESTVSNILGGTGGLAASAVTQRANGFRSTLVLNALPVASVTSVTGSDGVLVPLSGLDVDLAAGLIRSNATYYYASPYYPFLLPYYTVVYQSGYATLPADLVEAVKLMTQHLWDSQRGPRTGSGAAQAPGDDAYFRAMQILNEHPASGFA